ncbi:MAG: hypothetical protein K0U21_03495 [Proteobacteria bacterium]|nr:hypothetical protein [Pseudomonadota bacterium]
MKNLITASVIATAKQLGLDIVQFNQQGDESDSYDIAIHADDEGASTPEPIFVLYAQEGANSFKVSNIWGWDGKPVDQIVSTPNQLKKLMLSLFNNETFVKEFNNDNY